MNVREMRANSARHTLAVLESGHYTNEAGDEIYIAETLSAAMKQSALYEPAQFVPLIKQLKKAGKEIEEGDKKHTRIEVKAQTTLECAYDICVNQGVENVMVLNFASAKSPGGGFLNGAHAQEESLARASGLYYCLNTQPRLYEVHRQLSTGLYSDHMIYSPGVPVFKDDEGKALDDYYTVNMLSAPAVNRGAILQNEPYNIKEVAPAMLARIEKVLAVALSTGNTTLILGAWGCGVFRNDPEEIAGLFAKQVLKNTLFSSAFDHIIFAIPAAGDGKALAAFEKALMGKKKQQNVG